MTASIKGALESAEKALRFLADHDRPQGGQSRYNAEHLIDIADHAKAALASLSCGEARERIARIIDPNAGWGVKLDSDYLDLRQEQAKMEDEQRVALRKADAILATGCVPNEDAISDKREKIARARDHADRIRWLLDNAPDRLATVLELHRTARDIMEAIDDLIAPDEAAIRDGRGEG